MGSAGRLNRTLRALALVALGAILATAVVALAKKKPLTPAKPQPSPAVSIRPTGVGVPEIGAQGTVGIVDLAPALRSYHDGGQYESDLSTVDAQARSFMLRQAKALRQKRKRRCSNQGKKKNRAAASCRQLKLAIVLDIDETSLSNYAQLNLNNFGNATTALALSAVAGNSPAIAPTLDLYRQARSAGISVFAITGRPAAIEPQTRQNLNNAGYSDLAGVFFKPGSEAVVAFKSGQRAALEGQGYRIIANVGDQESDLAGGHADRSFKLPNPFYFIS
ncbi:MAG TPA: HAD family acid phosphatase [Solirubrobacterales bacterium]|jgi:predicted secreted acid phosphatase|nr:HAD family acid phosphatase [Solirubrobacterales bacterium]